jgi:deazaflavin-dependent oxidoreductase (nitroreductase family)
MIIPLDRRKENMSQTDHAINEQIVQTFRKNGGKVGGQLGNRTLLILHTIGAKSGKERVYPLTYLADTNHFYIAATNFGKPSHPSWYYNLLAHPHVTVEIGTETFEAQAAVIQGEEHDRVYTKICSSYPWFSEYQKTAQPRLIPVFELILKNK